MEPSCRSSSLPRAFLSPLVVLLAIWLLSLLDGLHAGRFRNIVDEIDHIPQIENFLKGNFAIEPHLAMIPGYHLAMAGLMKITGLRSLSGMRAINALLGLTAVAFFISSGELSRIRWR